MYAILCSYAKHLCLFLSKWVFSCTLNTLLIQFMNLGILTPPPHFEPFPSVAWDFLWGNVPNFYHTGITLALL